MNQLLSKLCVSKAVYLEIFSTNTAMYLILLRVILVTKVVNSIQNRIAKNYDPIGFEHL